MNKSHQSAPSIHQERRGAFGPGNPKRLLAGLALSASLTFAADGRAATTVWTGAGDQNWSSGGNWNTAVAPGAADDVQFFDTAGIYPVVDSSFGGTVASVRFGATNTDYYTTIPAAVTLNVTGAGGFRIGTPGDTGTAIARTASFAGNGALNLNNPAASLVLNQGTATSANGSRAILDLQGLDTFTANLSGIGLGTVSYANTVAQRNSGTLYLARTNLITLSYTQPLSVYLTVAAATNALEMVQVGAGNNAGTGGQSYLYLGQTNAFFVDSIGIGRSKSSYAASATMKFNPGFYAPVACFRGAGGNGSRVAWWGIGDMSAYASTAQHACGTNDFSGGTVDALVDTMSLGRDCSSQHTATGSGRMNLGVLTFDNGVIDVNDLFVGNQVLGPSGSTTPNVGIVNVNSAGATLVVNNTLTLARTTQTSGAATATEGIININGGTLRANTIAVGAAGTNHAIQVTGGGTLVISNTLGASKPIRTLTLADSTLELHLTGASPVVSATNLVTDGGGNTVNIGSSIVFDSYPAQVALFKYTVLSNTYLGVGEHNFTLGALPANVLNASLSNNTFNSSIDLYIATDPRPVITNTPVGFSGPPGSLVTLTVGVDGIAPFTYRWRRDGTNISDTGNWFGTATDTLTINNAQPGDNGDYTVVVSNAYGSTTSTPPAVVTISSGNVAPAITGPNDQSVVQGNNAILTASVSGVPAPAIQWYKNGEILSGETVSLLTIYNAQYPADEATYSIVATNLAGKATNSAFLTVVVPPGIAVHPSSVTVPQGSPASFTVVATGHPAPTYQWSKNSNIVPSATNATLSFASAAPADAASYSVLVSNAGGSTNSATATLTVTSTTLSYTNLSPANGATGVCYDTPLYIRFNTTPVLGSAGTLRIYDAADALVDTLDLSLNDANRAQLRTIGGGTYNACPVIIRSNTAAIYPHLGVMTSNTTYYVLMDAGFFKDAGGASLPAITSTTAWRFTTKVAGPDPYAVTNIVVASDGSGDFATVQGAIDWVPAGNTTPIRLLIRKGTYEEINRIPSGKNNLTFEGEGCQESVITYANNNTFQGPVAGTATRIMFYAGGNDLVFKNLTLTNSTPQGGSQAEAIRVQGMRIIIDNCRLCSFQDTVLVNTANTSTLYANKTLVQGQTDFIWGSGIGFFQSCEIKALVNGVNVQPRTPEVTYGFIFADCTLSRLGTGVTSHSLARDANTAGPYGNVAYLNCRMDSHIIPAGWTDGGLADKSTLRFWEYQSTDITGTTLINTSSRVPWSQQVDAVTNAMLRNLTNVFSTVSWVPQLAPYVACQPTNQSVLVGQTVTLNAAVGGVPEPVYQWYKASSPVAGGTNEVLVISNVQTGDGGAYSLRATNDLGYVISSNAVLTVSAPVPPTFGSDLVRLGDGSFQFSFSGGSGQSYRIWASSNVALAPVTSTWTLLGSGTFGGSAVSFTDTQATNYAQRFYVITVP